MSTYAQTYTTLLDNINKKFIQHNNLLHLKNYRKKVDCYKQNTKQADLYYQCFQNVESGIINDSQNFKKGYQYIEDEYKSCETSCTSSSTDYEEIKKCSLKCGNQYIESTMALYDNFYKSQLSTEPEYKKIKK